MRWLLVSLFLSAVVTGTSAARSSPASSPSPGPSPALVVHIVNYVYAPDQATIRAGDTVLFINDDAVPHTVTADDRSFNSGDLPQSAHWSHTFTKPGTFTYRCAYHAFMHGSVTVGGP